MVKIKIEVKIFIVWLIFFVEILAIVFMFSVIIKQHTRVVNKQNEEIERLHLIRNLQVALVLVVMPANDFVILGKESNEIEKFEVLNREIEELIAQIKGRFVFDNPEKKELLAQINKDYEDVKKLSLEIFALDEPAGSLQAGKLMKMLDKTANDVLNKAEKFHQFSHEEIEKVMLDMYKVEKFMRRIVFGGIASSAIVIFLGLFFFRQIITLPIKSMRKVILEVSKGNLEEKIKINSKDEIGDLALSFNKMTQSLKSSREELTASKKYTETIISDLTDALVIFNADGIIESVNRSALKILGYEEKECIGLKIENLFFDKEVLEKDEFKKIFKGENLENHEVTYRTKDNKPLSMLFSAVAMRKEDRQIAEIVSIAKDITERKQFEQKIQQNYQIQNVLNKILKISLEDISLEEILQKTIDYLTAISFWFEVEPMGGIFLTEGDSKILVLKAQRGFSSERQTLCGRVPFGECLCGKTALTEKLMFGDCKEQHDRRMPQTSSFPHTHYCVPIFSTDKKVIGIVNLYLKKEHRTSEWEEDFLYSVTNILAGIIQRKRVEDDLKKAYTDLKDTHIQLVQSEKMSAVGRLASGIAHEVKNPLAVILQAAEYLEDSFPLNENADKTLSIIKNNVTRADNIVCGLLDFSRETKLDMKEEDINAIVESSLGLIQHRVKLENVNISKMLEPDLPPILADKVKMEQVFVNIFLNAVQAMPKGGDLFIRSYLQDTGEKEAVFEDKKPVSPKEKRVIIEIEDNGLGIKKEHISKIFDPFFTTKGPQVGTGLGLSVTKNILDMHKGSIKITSQEGKGTKVVIVLGRQGIV